MMGRLQTSMSELPAPLRAAANALYQAFAPYPRPSKSHWSPYAGITEAAAARLQARPLRELAPADLDLYSRHALTVWGDDREYRHYLPRMLELLAVDPGWTDASLLVERLQAAPWSEWPEDERGAVVRFLDALWAWYLEQEPESANASDLLRGIGLAGLDLGPYVERWRAQWSHNAIWQRAVLILLEEPDLLATRSVGRRWHPKDRPIVNAFVLSADTRQALEDAYLAQPDRSGARDLARAADVLTTLGV